MHKIKVRAGNILDVNGSYLQVSLGIEILGPILEEAKPLILKTLEQYPLVSILRLTTNPALGIKQEAVDRAKAGAQAFVYGPSDIIPNWYANIFELIQHLGFDYEVREDSSDDQARRGLCLFVKKPSSVS